MVTKLDFDAENIFRCVAWWFSEQSLEADYLHSNPMSANHELSDLFTP